MAKIKSALAIALTDYKAVKWVGKTKGGAAVTIKLTDAINKENIDFTFAEKDDVVAKLTFEACYDNTDDMETDTCPWSIETASSVTAGAAEIILGVGIFYIGETAIALTRGGGSFTVEREIREINADGDMGAVKGRHELVGERAKLTMNALTFLTSMASMYPAVTVTTTT